MRIPQLEPHAGIKKVQVLGSLVYICGLGRHKIWKRCWLHSYKVLSQRSKSKSVKPEGEGRYIFGNWEKRMGNTYGTRHACVVIARAPSTRAAFVFFPGNFPNPICFDWSDLFRICVLIIKQMQEKNKAWGTITLLKISNTDLSALFSLLALSWDTNLKLDWFKLTHVMYLVGLYSLKLARLGSP